MWLYLGLAFLAGVLTAVVVVIVTVAAAFTELFGGGWQDWRVKSWRGSRS